MQINSANTAADVAHVLSFITPRPSYPDWVEVISAVGNTLPEDQAETVLLQWSPDERPGETRTKLRHRLHKVTFASLVYRAQQNGFDAKAWHHDRVKAGYLPTRRTPTPPALRPPPTPPAVLKTMPADTAAVYDEGLVYLRTNPAACAQIDTWRGYRSGTIAALAESGLVSSPTLHGKRCIAFIVQTADSLSAGFHARHRAPYGESAKWSYHPNGTPGLPFVLGGNCATRARTAIVCEGQWDAIALAAALGWVGSSAVWPADVILLGSRGAGGVRPIMEHWLPRIDPKATWHLFRDNDKAGESWHKFAAQLRTAGRVVRLRKPIGCKDVNDALRANALAKPGPITPKTKSVTGTFAEDQESYDARETSSPGQAQPQTTLALPSRDRPVAVCYEDRRKHQTAAPVGYCFACRQTGRAMMQRTNCPGPGCVRK